MIPSRLHWPVEQIEAFCRKWKIARLELFGSALRDDFRDDSDVDLMYTFEPDAGWSLFDVMDMKEELEELLERKVDFVSRRGLERSRNEYRKKAIFSDVATVYPA